MSYIRKGPSRPSILQHARGDDGVESRVLAAEVAVPLTPHAPLIGTKASRRTLAVVLIEAVDDVHALDDPANGRESQRVETTIVGLVDEELYRAGVRSSRRERDRSAHVALFHRIIRYRAFFPRAVHRRIAMNSKLRHEIGKDAKELHAVVISVGREVIEAIDAEWRPCANGLNDERSLACSEFHAK